MSSYHSNTQRTQIIFQPTKGIVQELSKQQRQQRHFQIIFTTPPRQWDYPGWTVPLSSTVVYKYTQIPLQYHFILLPHQSHTHIPPNLVNTMCELCYYRDHRLPQLHTPPSPYIREPKSRLRPQTQRRIRFESPIQIQPRIRHHQPRRQAQPRRRTQRRKERSQRSGRLFSSLSSLFWPEKPRREKFNSSAPRRNPRLVFVMPWEFT